MRCNKLVAAADAAHPAAALLTAAVTSIRTKILHGMQYKGWLKLAQACCDRLFAARTLIKQASDKHPRAGHMYCTVHAQSTKQHSISHTRNSRVNAACRNVTITGAQGLDTILDLDFVAAAVQLCANCSVTFQNITVANERHGVGEAVDFVTGQRSSSSSNGAAVLFVDANKLRLACSNAAAAAAVLQEAPRSNGDMQQASVQDAAFQVSKVKLGLLPSQESKGRRWQMCLGWSQQAAFADAPYACYTACSKIRAGELCSFLCSVPAYGRQFASSAVFSEQQCAVTEAGYAMRCGVPHHHTTATAIDSHEL